MRIAVIPARGGSKRIPRKNIKDFCGKPIIAWSIETARSSELFEHIIVSTDDGEIAEVARKYGAEVPFMRPVELSDDYVATGEVIAHAAKWALEQNWNVSTVCCIYATAPFIQVCDLKHGLQLLEAGEWDYSFSVTDFEAPVFRSFRINEDGRIDVLFPERFMARSQDLPVVLHDAGQFYWGRIAAWIEGKIACSRDSVTVFMPRWRVQDIDSPEDWLRAELLFRVIQGSQSY
jgi:pseudaminic acid cytidylyltransferase